MAPAAAPEVGGSARDSAAPDSIPATPAADEQQTQGAVAAKEPTGEVLSYCILMIQQQCKLEVQRNNSFFTVTDLSVLHANELNLAQGLKFETRPP